MVQSLSQFKARMRTPGDRRPQGFVTLLVVFGLPILLVVAFVFYFQLSVIQFNETLRNRCRAELLRSQHDLALEAEKLFQMNARVRLLRLRRKLAEAAYAIAIASGSPPAVVRAKIQLQIVKAAQLSERLLQRGLISQAQARMAATPSRTLQTMKSDFRKLASRQKQWMQLTWRPGSMHVGHFAVRKIDPTEEYPEYEPENPPEAKQALIIVWINTWKGQFKWTEIKPLEFDRRESCGATWVYKNNTLEAVLTKDKFFWK